MAKQKRGVEYIFGLNPVRETMRGGRTHRKLLIRADRRSNARVSSIVREAERARIPIVETDQRALDILTGRGNHQGIVLETSEFPYSDLATLLESAEGRTIVVLDHVQDPQNLATLIRTAAAVNIAGMIIQTDRSSSVTPAVVRSSAGLVEHVLVARENNTRRTIEALRESGYWATALESNDSSQNMFDAVIPEPVALVIGSEERGVSPNVLKVCDLVVELPMPGMAESLNAAVAGSVALFELLRRARVSGRAEPDPDVARRSS